MSLIELKTCRTVPAVVLLGVVCCGTNLPAGEFPYPTGRHEQGELRYINDLPVLMVAGTPEQIGQQVAVLTASSVGPLLSYPREYLKRQNLLGAWSGLVGAGNAMVANFPPDYRREMQAGIEQSQLDRDLIVVGNTMFDIRKIGGCSTLVVEPGRSKTGGPLFGRNLDFPTLGLLEKYSLVIVCRPEGKHAFANIGFPGLLGCLSGINDAGLTIATLEVNSTADGATSFNALGTPYAMCFRRLLEECTNIDEAETLLRAMPRTTPMNLAVCDRQSAAVLEMTPKNVVRRPATKGLSSCTNHFRTEKLATSTVCSRYAALEEARGLAQLGLSDVAARMHAANQGPATFQTMIFESAALKLHLALGEGPSSRLPLKELDLKPLLGP